MDFAAFSQKSWADHGRDAEAVAKRLPEGVLLMKTPEDLSALAGLATHVFGEHLGRWQEGSAFIEALARHPLYASSKDSAAAVNRSLDVLHTAAGYELDLASRSQSDQVRILATAASALNGQKETARSADLFQRALAQAADLSDPKDPAHRALAATGNNLACSLEENPSRTPAETQLMIKAAHAARTHWEIAGTWLEVERAEYRLAISYLKAGRFHDATTHAKRCLDVVTVNQGPALEYFFAYEVRAQIARTEGQKVDCDQAVTAMRHHFEMLSQDDKEWCKPILDTLIAS